MRQPAVAGQIVEHRAYTDGVATFSVFFEACMGTSFRIAAYRASAR